jgi:transcription initiation factor TFIID TATA-box-binding protein
LLRLLPELTIVNVIATAELGQFVDLERLTNIEGFLYDKAIYHCAYLKDQRTHAKVSIFTTGKMISIGTRSIRAATADLQHAAKRLADIGLISPTRVKSRLRNLVATAELGHEIDIESLAMRLPHVIYEPEQFPAAICYSEELEGASMLVFTSGKVVLAGLKREELLETGRKVLAKLADEIFRLSALRVPPSKAFGVE